MLLSPPSYVFLQSVWVHDAFQQHFMLSIEELNV